AFAVLELGGAATDVGIVLAVRILPLVGTLLVGGGVAAPLSPRGGVGAAGPSRVVTPGPVPVPLVSRAARSSVVAGASRAAGGGFFNPASTGLLPALVPSERVQEANGVRATALSGGEIIGPALAGVLIAGFGPGWALAVDAATFAVSALFLTRLELPARGPR